MATVELENVTKKFRIEGVVAVDDLALDVEDGEFIALLGPSGCGKTTTLLMIAGIYKPTEGSIFFDGVKVNALPPKSRDVGLVFQSYALYPHMTVFDNIAFPLKLTHIEKSEIKNRVERVAGLVDITNLLDRKPTQLSGGQQQRVALCRALVKEPSLLLLDEPLSNLDARLRIETRTELKKLQQKLGVTTIHVTHDQAEALSMTEKIAVINEGRLRQFSEPSKLYNAPQDLFVASFIGDPPMNLFEVEVREEGGELNLVNEAMGVKLTPPDFMRNSIRKYNEDCLTFGVRPEDIELGPRKTTVETPGDYDFSSEVYLTEPLGGGILVDFRLGEETFRVLTSQAREVKVGDKHMLSLEWESVHLFSGSTGEGIL